MVVLYVDGAKVGTLADAERLIPGLIANAKTVELRDEPTGRRIGTLTPEALCPWDPDLTREEAQRRIEAPGGTMLAEFCKQQQLTREKRRIDEAEWMTLTEFWKLQRAFE